MTAQTKVKNSHITLYATKVICHKWHHEG